MAVILCLIAAISLWKVPSSVPDTVAPESLATETPSESELEPTVTPIQIAHEGEVNGLLSDPPQRPVPEPQDLVEQPTLDHFPKTTPRTARVAPAEPSEPVSPTETELTTTTTATVPDTAQPAQTETAAERPASPPPAALPSAPPDPRPAACRSG